MGKLRILKWRASNIINTKELKGKSSMSVCPICGFRLNYWQSTEAVVEAQVNLDGTISSKHNLAEFSGVGFGGIECTNYNCKIEFDSCAWMDEGLWCKHDNGEEYTENELEELKERYIKKEKNKQ